MDIEKLWFQAADECSHCPVETRHRFAALVLDEAAKVCDITPPHPFRPSIEAAHAIRTISRQLSEVKSG